MVYRDKAAAFPKDIAKVVRPSAMGTVAQKTEVLQASPPLAGPIR